MSNRIRNSRSSQAFVQSLARLRLPAGGRVSNITLGDHESFVKENLERNLTPGCQADPTVSYIGDPNTIDSLIEDMTFREKIDVNYNPRIAARRRRIEWPTLDETLLARLCTPIPTLPPSQQAKDQVKAVLDEEIAKCDIRQPFRVDMAIVDEYTFRSIGEADFGQLISELYWRGRHQSAILDCFEVLVLRGFIDIMNICLPISMDITSQPVQSVMWLLSCFEGPRSEAAHGQEVRPLGHQAGFEIGLVWLATMIVRGCADIERLMETIEMCQFRGGLNQAAYKEYVKCCQHKHFTCNPAEMQDELGKPSIFGFWLPHGVKAQSVDEALDAIQQCVQRFNRIEDAYNAYFDVLDGVLVCEGQDLRDTQMGGHDE